jgi:hypothetical protein
VKTLRWEPLASLGLDQWVNNMTADATLLHGEQSEEHRQALDRTRAMAERVEQQSEQRARANGRSVVLASDVRAILATLA